MTTAALLLVLGSASIHACWNLIYKSATNKDAFALLKTIWSFVLLSLAAAWGLWHARPEPALWARAAISGVGYAAFFIFLSAGYRAGDFSLVYPITRGVGPMLAAFGGVLILGERLSPIGVVGIGLVLLAVTALSVLTSERTEARKLHLKPVLYACLVGCAIAVYSVNDKVVQLPAGFPMADRVARSFTFLWAAGGLSTLLLTGYCAAAGQLARVPVEWREGRARVLLAAFLDTLSYVLYLLALSLPGSKTAYLTPLRSASVVVAALLGAIVLRERHPAIRVCAAAVVLTGVVLVSRAGG